MLLAGALAGEGEAAAVRLHHTLACDAGHEAGDGEQQRGAGSHGHAAVMCHAVTLSRDCDGDVDGGTLGPDTAPTLRIVNQGSLGPE